MSVDSSAALPPGYAAVTANPETQTFAVLVDKHHARAHAMNKHRRNTMHQAGKMPADHPREKPVL